jgi:hypothetical protein
MFSKQIKNIFKKGKMNKKTIWLIFGIVALLAVAYIGGRYLTGEVNPLAMIQFNQGNSTVSSMSMEKSKDLPNGKPIVMGLFNGREDNLLKVKELNVSIVNGVASINMEDKSTIEHEVLITKDTRIFNDITDYSGPDSNGVFQQKVEKSDLEKIADQAYVMVWGRKSGDRFIADTISFSNK